MVDFFRKLFDTSDFPARWHCGQWTDFHGWLYIGSNLIIWAAYFGIPLTLLYLVQRRRDLPFRRMFWLFTAFILLCGLTHLVDALIFWVPIYRFNALLLLITGVVSVATLVYLFRTLPQALELKTPAELKETIRRQTAALEESNQQLARSEQQLRTLVEHIPDVISHLDRSLTYRFINGAIRGYRNLPPEHYVGKNLGQVGLAPPVQEALETFARRAFSSGQPVEGAFVYEGNPAVPAPRFVHLSVVPLRRDADGQVEEVLMVSRDNTRQWQAERVLQQKLTELEQLSKTLTRQNRRLQDYAHIISHNLRAPVGSLTTLIRLHQEAATPAQQQEVFARIAQVGGRLMDTVEDLSQVISIHQDTDLPSETLVFAEVLRHVAESVHALLSETQATLTTDFQVATVHYPRVYLTSILLNLLTNAVKYASPQRPPRLHFATYWQGARTVLTCEDNGLGIDLAKHGKRLFGLHKTFHNHPDGRGVGLFITRNQVEALGGTIEVESRPGAGSRFLVTLDPPLVDGDAGDGPAD